MAQTKSRTAKPAPADDAQDEQAAPQDNSIKVGKRDEKVVLAPTGMSLDVPKDINAPLPLGPSPFAHQQDEG